MTPSTWAIKNPFWPFLIIALMAVLGVAAALRLPQTHLPQLGLDRIDIELSTPGLSATEIQTRILGPAEAILRGTEGLLGITTSATSGTTRITLELGDPAALQRLQPEIEDRLQRLRASTDGAITAHTITTRAGRASPLRTIAVTNDSLPLGTIGRQVVEEWQPALTQISGIRHVAVTGAWLPKLLIEADALRLAGVGLTPSDLHQRLPAILEERTTAPAEQNPSLSLRALLPDELAAHPISLADGSRIALSEVAHMRLMDTPPETIVRYNGAPAILLTILPQPHVDVPSTALQVDDELARLRALTPGTHLTVVDDGAAIVAESLEATWRTLLEGCALVILVVAVALRSLRATFVAALALPLSILPTLALMDAFGLSLNLISLLGLTLAAGLLVDDAIVEVENIQQRLDKGMEPKKAARTGARAISRAVAATTFAVIAVFLPVAFMPGLAGRYFMDFGLTISIASLVSLAVARLVIPPLAAQVLKTRQNHAKGLKGAPTEANNGLARLFQICVEHPIAISLLLIGITLPTSIAVFERPGTFIPEAPGERMAYLIVHASDTPLPETDAALNALAGRVWGLAGVLSLRTEAGLPNEGSHAGILQISLSPQATEQERADIDGRVRSQTDALVLRLTETGQPRLALHLFETGSLSSPYGALPLALETLVASPEIAQAHALGGNLRPALRFLQDPSAITALGLDANAIANAIALTDPRQASTPLPDITLADGRILPIEFSVSGDLEDPLATVTLQTPSGAILPLSTLIRPEIVLEPLAIERRNGQATLPIWIEPAPGITPSQAMQAAHRSLAAPETSARHPMLSITPSGNEEQRASMVAALANAMLLSMLVLGATLFALFRSVTRTLIIILTLPLALIGAFAGLALTGLPLSLPVYLGVMLCLGIVAKNAILILDAAQRNEQLGSSSRDAMIKACLERSRPILMTSLAMIAGMVPAVLEGSEGSIFRAPLAITVIAGISTATILAFFAVPAMDSISKPLRRSRKDPLAKLAREARLI
ncbi:efflux RND transporter permease subunit [Pararhodobacter sp. CCB-MM2]|uniref:efflux RND transporter permease subunit n=1 Tax=Pararhodobacter sp. CCB-MM2 TaxID=1786003 RepID=UPI00082E18CD|nr:efflux RND transporter permease subunit [Pararhodobacter sp. CCB-MM2]